MPFKDVTQLASSRDHFLTMEKIASKKIRMFTASYGPNHKWVKTATDERAYYQDQVADLSIQIMQVRGEL